MDNGTLIFKRDITDAMIRLEVWSTEEGIYIQTFDIDDSTMLSSDLIGAVKLLSEIDTKVNNTSLLNEDANIKNDCNDNNTPLVDDTPLDEFFDQEVEYHELTNTQAYYGNTGDNDE